MTDYWMGFKQLDWCWPISKSYRWITNWTKWLRLIKTINTVNETEWVESTRRFFHHLIGTVEVTL